MLRKIKRVSCVNHSVASSIMEMHHSQAIVTIIFFSPLFPRAPPLFLRKKKLVSACCFFIIICACLDENLIIIFFTLFIFRSRRSCESCLQFVWSAPKVVYVRRFLTICDGCPVFTTRSRCKVLREKVECLTEQGQTVVL